MRFPATTEDFIVFSQVYLEEEIPSDHGSVHLLPLRPDRERDLCPRANAQARKQGKPQKNILLYAY